MNFQCHTCETISVSHTHTACNGLSHQHNFQNFKWLFLANATMFIQRNNIMAIMVQA